jgi:hypothetical protein
MHNFVILYADEILLLSPSLSEERRMFTACERELTLLDMTMDAKNRVAYALDFDLKPAVYNINTATGIALPWIKTLRYFGAYIVSSRSFKCSFGSAKRSSHRSLNAIFGKVSRKASE